MDTILNNILNGNLPTVNVSVKIDNESILKLAGAFLSVVVIGALLHAVLTKHSK